MKLIYLATVMALVGCASGSKKSEADQAPKTENNLNQPDMGFDRW